MTTLKQGIAVRLGIVLVVAASAIAFSWATPARAEVVSWISTGTSTAWYTAANWSPNTSEVGGPDPTWATGDIAQFNNTGSATVAGINMDTASLSIGAIEVGAPRIRALTIGNSSTTVGTLTLNGATVNGVPNTILRNDSSTDGLGGGAGFNLNLQNNSTGTGKTMNIVVPNANSVIAVDSVTAGNIVISSNISGDGGLKITRVAGGTGQVQLTGMNDYLGDTTIDSARLRAGGNGIPNGAGRGNVILQGTVTSSPVQPLFGISGNETINGLSGVGFVDNDTSGPLTLTIGDGNDGGATSTFSGTIYNTSGNPAGTLGITKMGTGVLTLSGNNSYVGATTVNGGTLLVNGTHTGLLGAPQVAAPVAAYTVASEATLGGTGRISANVIV
ncbi:MAG: autotransporter-associated beta strand repeat-containing protein, partial [Pirellulales bacterium]